MSKKQYELLTEAMADGLSTVMLRDSRIREEAARVMVRSMANYLALDNQNFDKVLFIEQVEAQAVLMYQVLRRPLNVDL